MVGHPALVRLALDAAVANALKFSPEDTPVDVVVARDDDWLTVVVRDRGPGVEPATLGRSLPFARGEAGYPGGASLGLLAARTALQRLGGQLHVGKAPGGGGEVEMRFPATVGASRAQPDELAPHRPLVAPIVRAWRRLRTG